MAKQTPVKKPDAQLQAGTNIPSAGYDPDADYDAEIADYQQQGVTAAPHAASFVLPTVQEPRIISISVPLMATSDIPSQSTNYQAGGQNHVDIQLRPHHHAVLKRLYFGLDAAGARLADGRRIASKPDAIRWLLELLEKSGQ